MKSQDELKELNIKNCTCYYLNDIMKVWNRYTDFSDILLDKKLYREKYENILIDEI